ncbi:MAG TPA: hydrogenase maturation protease [Candidatus Koribacter sp.]|jgi:hydrogenase maturation protease
MSKILVIGYGNPLRADDGVGCHGARQIAHHLRGDDRVEVIPCHELEAESARKVAAAEFVIFIDATHEGEPGSITETTVLPDAAFDGKFHHKMTPESLLAAAKALHGECPPALQFHMTGWCFEIGEHMSAIVTERFKALVKKIEEKIREHEAVLA